MQQMYGDFEVPYNSAVFSLVIYDDCLVQWSIFGVILKKHILG